MLLQVADIGSPSEQVKLRRSDLLIAPGGVSPITIGRAEPGDRSHKKKPRGNKHEKGISVIEGEWEIYRHI